MPAKSKAQQRFMGMVHAVQKGDMDAPSSEVEKAADSMSDADAKDYASTKHKGLPNHIKKEIMEKELKEIIRQTYRESLRESINEDAAELPQATIPSSVKIRLQFAIEKIQDSKLSNNAKLQLLAQVIYALDIDKSQLSTIVNKIRSNMESVQMNEISSIDGLVDVVKGQTSHIEGIKLSKDMAGHIISWMNTSPYGRKYNSWVKKNSISKILPIAFNWGLDRGVQSNLKNEFAALKAKYGKKENESVNETISHEAMGIASMTNTRKEAVQKFIDDNNLDAQQILKDVTKGKLPERVRFIQALVGTPNNSSFKWYVKTYANESVNEGTITVKTKDGRLQHYPNFKKDDVISFLTKNKMKQVNSPSELKSNMDFYIVESVNEATNDKKRFMFDFYTDSNQRNTERETNFLATTLESAIKAAEHICKVTGYAYVEIYYKDLFLGSMKKQNGFKFVEGRGYPKFKSTNESTNEAILNEGKKVFKVNPGIGSSKYSISSHDGVKKHKDGSDFYDIHIFKNKVDLEKGIKDYKSKGFIEETINESDEPSDIIKDLDKVRHDLIKKVDVLIAKKKKLYSNVDITTPMSADEKQLDKDIQSIFSQIQNLIQQKRKIQKESINESVIKEGVYKTILSNNTGKLFFSLVDDETDKVTDVDAKAWLKSTIKDKASDSSKELVLAALVRQINQFNKKVEYNMWVNANKPTWEEKIKHLLDKRLVNNVNKSGIKVH